MAEETTNTTLNNVLLGDTVAEVVEKINAGFAKANQNAVDLSDYKEDLTNGDIVVEKATYATYDASQKSVEDGKRVTINDRLTALAEGISKAGAVDDVKVNGTSVVDDDKVANITVPKKVSELENDSGYISSTEKGAKSGIATLDENGLVPSSQLPSYVDDVVEYDNFFVFPATGETGKIYLALDTNKQYRWGGTAYTEISSSLALGETSSTAYAGDKGKANADAIKEIQDNYISYPTEQTSSKLNEIVLGFGSRQVKGSGVKIKRSDSLISDPFGTNNKSSNDETIIPTGALTHSIALNKFKKFIVSSTFFDVSEDDNYKTYTAKNTLIQYGYPLSLVNADGKPLVAELYMNSDNYAVIVVDKSKDLFTTNTYVYVRFLGA